MSAVVEAPALPESPFKGLIPYTEDDAAFFFGRDEEIEVVIANLEARRLTLLYGDSGVGKSSLLRAGVLHRLLETSRRNLEELGTPEVVPVYFAAWRDDPVAGLLDAIAKSVSAAIGGPADEVPPSRRLDEALERWAGQADADILIVLDQFEEYFLYHPPGRGEDAFAAELPRALNNAGLRARFVLAIREDALAKLDRFKRAIPGLFNTYLRVRHLNRESAREAIRRPIEEYNRISRGGAPRFDVEPKLVEAVLDQVTAGRVVLEQAGAGAGIDDSAAAEERIEAPYLQLVMSRLWDEERRSGSGVLRRATLERLGGAKRIVQTHLDEAMSVLLPTERNIAAGLFRHLVTPSGTKIAFSASDLAAYVSLPKLDVKPVLARLSAGDVRILRTVEPPPGEMGETRYEIFHDVLAGVVLDWRTRYLKDCELGDNVRLGYAGLVHGLIAWFLVLWNIAFIWAGIAETPWYFLGLVWSLGALIVWVGATRALFRRWSRRQSGLWLAVPIAELAALTAPISIVMLGLRRLELRRPASQAGDDGPFGRPRRVRTSIILFFCTLGLYGLYWIFRTQHETAAHTGTGAGGVVGVTVWLLVLPVGPFIVSSEVGKLYRRKRLDPPVSAWTGLWFFPFGLLIVPAFVWFAKVQGALNRYWTEIADRPSENAG